MPYCTGLRPDEQESVCYRYLMQDADAVYANMVAVRSHLTKPSMSVATQPQSHPSNMTEYICEHVCLCRFQSSRWQSALPSGVLDQTSRLWASYIADVLTCSTG